MEVSEDPEVTPSAEANHSSNIASDEIDQETASKLRGDAIGNTMYSEVFVLNTLLQFSDLKWSSEVEDNLCFLWDMTEEKDVRQYLFKLSYPKLACSAIINHNEPRFIEIVVGIFANLLCSGCENAIKEDDIKTVLNLLSSDDPYILIQVMRFIHAVSFMYDKLNFISSDLLDKFDFILCNSTNKELLTLTLKTLSSITDGMKLDESALKGELLMSVVTAYRTIQYDYDTELEMLESQEHHLNAKYLIQFVCNMCSYIDTLNVNRFVNQLNLNLLEFTKEVVPLLNYYKCEDNLFPIEDDFKFYIEALTYIYRILSASYIPSIAKTLYEICSIMYKKDSVSLEIVSELVCYFISVGNRESLQQDFLNLPSEDVKSLLSYIEKKSFCFEFEYMENVKTILTSL